MAADSGRFVIFNVNRVFEDIRISAEALETTSDEVRVKIYPYLSSAQKVSAVQLTIPADTADRSDPVPESQGSGGGGCFISCLPLDRLR